MDEYNPSINGTTEVQPQGYQDQTLAELPTDKIVQESEDFEIETSNDRTREQFNKLKTKNKEMYEELQQLRKTRNADSVAYGSVYDTFKADPFAGIPTSDTNEEYVDEEGNVDIKKLNADIKAAKMSALEAKRLAEQAREDYEVKEAHSKHPYLDPQNSEFDPQFFELVKDRVLRQRYYEGKNIPLGKIADEVSSFYKPGAKGNVEKTAIENYKKTQAQIANTAPLVNSNRIRQEQSNLNDLRERTSKGDSSAIQERLKALGI
jgi:hypothetical protein